MVHKLGNINPCGMFVLYAGGKPVAECLSTPAARGYAFRKCPTADYGIEYIPGWPLERINRHNWEGGAMDADKAAFRMLA